MIICYNLKRLTKALHGHQSSVISSSFLLILVKVKILVSVIMVPLDFADVRGMYAFYNWTAFITGQLL